MDSITTLIATFEVAAIVFMFATRRRTRVQNARLRRALKLWVREEIA